jgi:hypothetical protein
MVPWFDPAQLVRTGVDVVISAIFAGNSDRRVLDALSHPGFGVCDYSGRDELWLDYVADTADEWNSTYAVAHALAQPTLDIGVDGETRTLRRCDVLVFGGDEVYPVASREGYERRLIAPYRTALPGDPGAASQGVRRRWEPRLVRQSRRLHADHLHRRQAPLRRLADPPDAELLR